jgi:hypothetical protein
MNTFLLLLFVSFLVTTNARSWCGDRHDYCPSVDIMCDAERVMEELMKTEYTYEKAIEALDRDVADIWLYFDKSVKNLTDPSISKYELSRAYYHHDIDFNENFSRLQKLHDYNYTKINEVYEEEYQKHLKIERDKKKTQIFVLLLFSFIWVWFGFHEKDPSELRMARLLTVAVVFVIIPLLDEYIPPVVRAHFFDKKQMLQMTPS